MGVYPLPAEPGGSALTILVSIGRILTPPILCVHAAFASSRFAVDSIEKAFLVLSEAFRFWRFGLARWPSEGGGPPRREETFRAGR
jgi:hypothetical protein